MSCSSRVTTHAPFPNQTTSGYPTALPFCIHRILFPHSNFPRCQSDTRNAVQVWWEWTTLWGHWALPDISTCRSQGGEGRIPGQVQLEGSKLLRGEDIVWFSLNLIIKITWKEIWCNRKKMPMYFKAIKFSPTGILGTFTMGQAHVLGV